MLNRETIFEAIAQHLARESDPDRKLAVLMLRLEGLPRLAVRFGYAADDGARRQIEARLRQTVRPVDRVFQAHDDVFALILPGLRGSSHALLAAAALARALEAPLDGLPFPVRGRPVIGGAIYPDHAESPEGLCRHAEAALHEASRQGESCLIDLQRAAEPDIVYEELRDAIDGNQLQVHFQPVRHLESGSIAGIESLARWSHAVQGPISPASFVPFAEQCDLILALTRWSIHATLRQARALRRNGDFTVAINLSPRALTAPGMVEQLADALDIWGMQPASLIVEITETALASDLEASAHVVARLRERGIRVAIDDFGAGYASIAYLRRFAATDLKIDRCLIADLQRDARTAKLVQAVVHMAHAMDMEVVAEGVENPATEALLDEMGCDYAQGYHVGYPEPAADFIGRWNAEHAPVANSA